MFKNSFYYLVVFLFAFAVIAGCGKEEPKQKTEEKKQEPVKQQTTETKQDTVKDVKKDGDKTETKTDGKKMNYVKFETTMGNFKVKLFSDKAPLTTANFRGLVEKSFFDGEEDAVQRARRREEPLPARVTSIDLLPFDESSVAGPSTPETGPAES